MLRKLVKMAGVKVPLDKLPLPDMLYFWAAAEGPSLILTSDYTVLPLFSSESSALEWHAKNLKGRTQVGGPNDGAEKEFRGVKLDTVHDLKILFGMVESSKYECTKMTIDPPQPEEVAEGEDFDVTGAGVFLAYARERSEKLYWEGRLTRSNGSVIRSNT